MKILFLLLGIAILSNFWVGQAKEDSAMSIIPAPAEMKMDEGCGKLSLLDVDGCELQANLEERELLYSHLKREILDVIEAQKAKMENEQESESISPVIALQIDATQIPEKEGYTLEVGEAGVRIVGGSPAGVFYGIQALRQMIRTKEGKICKYIPFCKISDAPRFSWRGAHLDVSRHFFEKEFLYRYLDLMALHRMNVLHWHLVDGPGWRLEIKRFPRLTEIGAWRQDKRDEKWEWQASELYLDGRERAMRKEYGGFYTKDDVKDIVEYARRRFITVMPEIEMPGHSYAALLAYPEYACEGVDVLKDGLRGRDVFCAGQPEVLLFFKGIIDEVCEMFPSPYIHLGGDEVPYESWLKCTKCRQKMKDLGNLTPQVYHTWFMNTMARYVRDKGKIPMGWDEMCDGGDVTGARLMCWRGDQFGHRALKRGMPVVFTSMVPAYFNMRQSEMLGEPMSEPQLSTLKMVYDYEPVTAELTPQERQLVMGIQGCLWTEHIQSAEGAEYMLLPRLCALSERMWSPMDRKNYNEFLGRLEPHLKHLKSLGYHYRDGFAKGDLRISPENAPEQTK